MAAARSWVRSYVTTQRGLVPLSIHPSAEKPGNFHAVLPSEPARVCHDPRRTRGFSLTRARALTRTRGSEPGCTKERAESGWMRKCLSTVCLR